MQRRWVLRAWGPTKERRGGWGMTSPLVSTTSDLDWWSTTVLDHFAGGGNVPEPCPFLFAFAKICLVSNSIQAQISVESTSIYWFGQISTTSIKKRCELSSVQMVSSAAHASSSSLYPRLPSDGWSSSLVQPRRIASKYFHLVIFHPSHIRAQH